MCGNKNRPQVNKVYKPDEEIAKQIVEKIKIARENYFMRMI